MFDRFLFQPQSSSYNAQSFPGEICNLNGVVCLFLPSTKESSHLILYCHANATDIGIRRKYLKAMRDQLGLHLIAIEYPGYGISKGTPNQANIDKSVRLVYEYLHVYLKMPKQSIIVMGRSIGTGPALKLASIEDIGALILVSPFTSIQSVLKGKVGYAAKLVTERWNSLKNIAGVRCPVLFVHGMIDDVIPVQHSLDLHQACLHNCKDIFLMEGVGHNQLWWNPIHDKILNFLKVRNVTGIGVAPQVLYFDDPNPRINDLKVHQWEKISERKINKARTQPNLQKKINKARSQPNLQRKINKVRTQPNFQSSVNATNRIGSEFLRQVIKKPHGKPPAKQLITKTKSF